MTEPQIDPVIAEQLLAGRPKLLTDQERRDLYAAVMEDSDEPSYYLNYDSQQHGPLLTDPPRVIKHPQLDLAGILICLLIGTALTIGVVVLEVVKWLLR